MAGVEPQHGLYAILVALFLYAISARAGVSRQHSQRDGALPATAITSLVLTHYEELRYAIERCISNLSKEQLRPLDDLYLHIHEEPHDLVLPAQRYGLEEQRVRRAPEGDPAYDIEALAEGRGDDWGDGEELL